jgi:hypothetical protein
MACEPSLLLLVNALWGMLTNEKYDIEDPIKKKIAHIMSVYVIMELNGAFTFIEFLG